MAEFDPSDLSDLLATGEPMELRRYLATPDPSRIRFHGTTVPILGVRALVSLSSGLVAPSVSIDTARYIASYLTLTEYFPQAESEDDVRALIDFLADDHERIELVAQVARLNHLAGRADLLAQLEQAYRATWKPDVQD